MDSAKEFSWGRAVLKGLLVSVFFFVTSLPFAMLLPGAGEQIGAFSANFILPAFPLGVAWSYAQQREKRTMAAICLVALVAMSAYQVFVLGTAAMQKRGNQEPLSAGQKAAPTIKTSPESGVLCQPQFGIRLPLRGLTLTAAPDLSESMSQNSAGGRVVHWVYREADNRIVAISAARGFDSEAGLNSYVKGSTEAARTRGFEVIQQSVAWYGSHGEIVLAFRGAGALMSTRCISATNGDLICIQTITSVDEPDPLADLRKGLAFGGCG